MAFLIQSTPAGYIISSERFQKIGIHRQYHRQIFVFIHAQRFFQRDDYAAQTDYSNRIRISVGSGAVNLDRRKTV